MASQVFMVPVFQSTPPARGATSNFQLILVQIGISIHAPREGGDDFNNKPRDLEFISIHAPREGGDRLYPAFASPKYNISIHAPREGGDNQQIDPCGLHGYFNPRPPRGGRPYSLSSYQ